MNWGVSACKYVHVFPMQVVLREDFNGLTYRGIVQEVTLLCILDLPDDITKLGCHALVPRSDYDRADAGGYHSRDCHGEKNRQ